MIWALHGSGDYTCTAHRVGVASTLCALSYQNGVETNSGCSNLDPNLTLNLISSLTPQQAQLSDGSSTIPQPYVNLWRSHGSSYSVRSPCCSPNPLDRLTPNGSEFFWDYICPFSGKSAKCIKNVVAPWLDSHAKGKVKIFFRLQVQPWCVCASIIATLMTPGHLQLHDSIDQL